MDSQLEEVVGLELDKEPVEEPAQERDQGVEQAKALALDMEMELALDEELGLGLAPDVALELVLALDAELGTVQGVELVHPSLDMGNTSSLCLGLRDLHVGLAVPFVQDCLPCLPVQLDLVHQRGLDEHLGPCLLACRLVLLVLLVLDARLVP